MGRSLSPSNEVISVLYFRPLSPAKNIVLFRAGTPLNVSRLKMYRNFMPPLQPIKRIKQTGFSIGAHPGYVFDSAPFNFPEIMFLSVFVIVKISTVKTCFEPILLPTQRRKLITLL